MKSGETGMAAGGVVKKRMIGAKGANGGEVEVVKLKGAALVEWRRRVVSRCLLARMTVRQIQAELASRAKEEGGKGCGLGTVGRDVQAVREEWALGRKAAVDELIGEELARLRELEVVWWERSRAGGSDAGEAADRVLAIMRQRAALLGLGSTSGRQAVQVTAGALAGAGNGDGPVPAGAQVKVLVEYVDDRRELGI